MTEYSWLRARSTLLLLLATLTTVLLAAACDDGAGEDDPEPEPEPEVLEPITVTAAQRSFGYFPGDDTFLAPQRAELNEKFAQVTFRGQLLDELAISRGESVADSRFAARTEALMDEAGVVLTQDKSMIVLDLMRLSDGQAAGATEPYLVSWDNNNRPLENYGFWRSDYRQAVLDQIELAARDIKPTWFIVGAEMERYLDMPGGESDYANFVTLYREAYALIKRESPETRVGAGIDWVRLMNDRAPLEVLSFAEIPEAVVEARELTPGQEAPCGPVLESPPTDELTAALRAACVDKAFRHYVEPLLRYLDPMQPAPPVEGEEPEVPVEPRYVHTADVLAVAALGTQDDFGNDPNTVPDDFFAGLRSWSRTFPVVYYDVDWRVTGPVGATRQNEWLQALIDGSFGVDVELISWSLIKDLDTSDCGKLTSDLFAPPTTCFRGLWAASTNPKDVYDTFITDIVPEPAAATP